MGTSSSSSGPKSGVPLIPSWRSPIPVETEPQPVRNPGNIPQPENDSEQLDPNEAVKISPARRFSNARKYLGEYAKNGDRNALRKALGSYSRIGMGGAANIARRMHTSIAVGAGLFNFLQKARENPDIRIREWVAQLGLKNLTASEVADEIINQIISTGGSLDEESCRDSMAQAMADLLTINSDIDLLNMDNDSIWTIVELYMANEAFNRLYLDIGQIFESVRYSPIDAVSRMNEMREYLKSEISAQIQQLRTDTFNLEKEEMNALLQSAIKITFEVFEDVL
jgi:hypothetical protein